jgi:hypothetical protein
MGSYKARKLGVGKKDATKGSQPQESLDLVPGIIGSLNGCKSKNVGMYERKNINVVPHCDEKLNFKEKLLSFFSRMVSSPGRARMTVSILVCMGVSPTTTVVTLGGCVTTPVGMR